MSLPYALMPVCRQQFIDGNGDPYAGGKLYFFIAGTTTPKSVYSTADGAIALGTYVDLDSSGYAPAIYLAPGGYKVQLWDQYNNIIWTQDGVEDIASTFFDQIGVEWSAGGNNVTSGYEVLNTDTLVTVASTGGPNPCIVQLKSASDHGSPLCIKNLGTVPVAVRPMLTDTIDGLDEDFTLPAAMSPIFPAIWMLSDGMSGWWIIASHGIATAYGTASPSSSASASPSGV